jgi:carbonic anhydrase
MLCSCDQKKSDTGGRQAQISALQRLVEGNKRYADNKPMHPRQGEERRKGIIAKQAPYAVIVGCSDSRVPPEIIFDEGLGDLFVVRVAGNVLGPIELESVAYSVSNFNPSIILVLGHENCRAIKRYSKK